MDTAAGAGHRRVVALLLALAPCAARAQALAPAYLASSYFPAPHPAPAPELPAPLATLATPPGPGVFSSRRGRGQQLQPRFPSRPPAVVGAELNAVFDPAPAPSSASPTPPQLFSGDVHLPSPGPAGLVLLGGGLGPQGQQPAPSPAPPSEAAPPPAGVPAQVGPALPAVPGLEQGCGVRVVEECRQQYEMVCEETVARRLQERCQEVTTQTCEDTLTTEYEPACFQRIISHCTGVCKRAVTSDCAPACARSLAAPSCKRVKVVTPGQVCTPVTNQVCGPEEVEVPYTKCRDEPRELVCEKVERPSCGQ